MLKISVQNVYYIIIILIIIIIIINIIIIIIIIIIITIIIEIYRSKRWTMLSLDKNVVSKIKRVDHTDLLKPLKRSKITFHPWEAP